MQIEHNGARPRVAASAYVAPNAVLCGDVEVGPGCRVLFGAVLTAEDGPVRLGEACLVMEQAVLRGRAQHPVWIGDRVLVGPHAHVNGAHVEDEAFIATGASLFPGSVSLLEQERWVIDPPDVVQGMARHTLTLPALKAARRTYFLVTGAAKAAPLARIRAGEPLPAGMVKGATWLVDSAAAG